MLPLDTKTLNALRQAHITVYELVGKKRQARIVRCLEMDIKLIVELTHKTKDDLSKYFDIGPLRIKKIEKALQACGFTLNTQQPSLLV
jgi:hypothetical protein